MKHMDKSIAAMTGSRLLGFAIASVLMCAAVSGPVRAAEATAPAKATQAATPLFDMLDANKDQVLSRQEFQSGYAGLQRYAPECSADWDRSTTSAPSRSRPARSSYAPGRSSR